MKRPPLPLRTIAREAKALAGRVDVPGSGEVRSYSCSACGVEPVGPRPGVCRACQQRESALDQERRRMEQLLVPLRFRWARVDLAPFAPQGIARWCAHPEAVRRVRASRAVVLVLRGETRAGKTALAVAKLYALACDGWPGVFVPCQDLGGAADDQERAVQLYRRALAARVVVLDDLGKELGNAPSESAMSAFRGERVCRLIRELHDRSGVGAPARRLIVTIWQDAAELARSHGGDIVGRLLEEGGHEMEVIDLDGLAGARR